MGLFGKKAKKKESKPNLEKRVADNIAKDTNAECAIITYILIQAEQNNIYLGKKGDLTYISFKNETITAFLNEWYNLLKLKQENKISDNTYKFFVENALKQNKISDSDTKPKNIEDSDDLISI